MILTLLLATATALGMPWWRIVLLSLVALAPVLAAALVSVLWWKARPGADSSAALFCEAVAAELRAGASLRGALTAAASAVGASPPSADAPLSDVSVQLAETFEVIGDELRLTIASAERSGGAAAAVFDELGSLALAQAEVRHEVKMATAPGRATALVLLGAPFAFVVSRLSSGEMWVLLSTPHQRLVALIGLGIFGAGLAIAAIVVWRA